MGNYILYYQNLYGWGSKIIKQLAKAIRFNYPEKKGYSERNLTYMCQFARSYPLNVLRSFIDTDVRLSVPNIQNVTNEVLKLSFHFMEILAKDKPDEPSKQEKQQDVPKDQPEYFNTELLSLIHKVCVGEQFEDIATQDFYANMNLYPSEKGLKIKAREKIRVCYLIFLMSERLSKQDRDKWKNTILRQLDIDENYYKSKYKELVSDFPSNSNQNFSKEMDAIFR